MASITAWTKGSEARQGIRTVEPTPLTGQHKYSSQWRPHVPSAKAAAKGKISQLFGHKMNFSSAFLEVLSFDLFKTVSEVIH